MIAGGEEKEGKVERFCEVRDGATVQLKATTSGFPTSFLKDN